MQTTIQLPVLKKFNSRQFRLDVFSFRTNDLRWSRKKFADELYINENVLKNVETEDGEPRCEMFMNLCLAMGKDPMEYFK